MTDGETTTAFEETELVERARGGDHEAFTVLADRYAPRVYRTARHMLKNDAEAEDVLQEAFLKAYSRLDQFAGNSQFYTWLSRIAVNEALMKLRKNKRTREVSLDQELETEDGTLSREIASDGEDPEEIYGRGEIREAVEQAVDSLSEGHREVFVLRDVEGFSTEETARMLGLSISNVKSRLLRARLQLRNKLGNRVNRNGRTKEDHL